MKPRIFIGSSREGKDIANAIQQNLKDDAFCDVWTQGIFGLAGTTLDSLLKAVTEHDFGVFVLSPDDVNIIRQTAYAAARDNVLFELALFTGRYGRHRAYMVTPMGVKDFHIPTDLLGVTAAEYDPEHVKLNRIAALGTASDQIRSAIHSDHTFNRMLRLNLSCKTGGTNYPLKLWFDIRNQTGTDVVIKSDYLLVNGSIRPSQKATGNPKRNEYELKLPHDKELDVFDYLLRNGRRVQTWFPLDETQTESEVQTAISNGNIGELHFTCYWLGQPTLVQDYVVAI